MQSSACRTALFAVALLAACGDGGGNGQSSASVVAARGDNTASVDEFRALLGGANNGGTPGEHAAGRREINWDGVPDELAAPNFLPPDFFNAAAAPRARGAFFATPGDGVQVSADADNPAGAAVRFGDVNPTYADRFVAFSEERLFSPLGSNIVDLTFFVAGSDVPAAVSGFGAVYTGVDRAGSAFEFFDRDDRLLGRFPVPRSEEGRSFLGVAFDEAVVARVRIAYGNVALGPDEGAGVDVAVMDDFIYGEPHPIAQP